MSYKNFILSSIVLVLISASCTTSRNHFNEQKHPAGIFTEIKFEGMFWESTQDSMVWSMSFPDETINFSPNDIKEVVIEKNGYVFLAGYLNWGRDNLFKYEIINGRLLLYCQRENLTDSFSNQVTVIIRLASDT